MSIKMILAVDAKGNIGKGDELLYSFEKDLKRFKEFTSGGIVVMGRTTWESLPFKLPNRENIVLSSMSTVKESKDGKFPERVVNDIDSILEIAKEVDVWIIGGAQVYNQFWDYSDEVFVTMVGAEFYGEFEDIVSIDISKLDSFDIVSIEEEEDIDRISGVKMGLQFKRYIDIGEVK